MDDTVTYVENDQLYNVYTIQQTFSKLPVDVQQTSSKHPANV